MGFGSDEAIEVEGGGFLSCYRPAIPQPPPLDDVWEALESARSRIDTFDRAVTAFPIPGVIGKLFARHDAVHSSGAEGATTTFTDLLEYQSSLRRAKDPDDTGSVAGCAEAFDNLQDETGDPRDAARAIHRRLFERLSDPYAARGAGAWKSAVNATLDTDAPTGFFHYTAPGTVAAALAEWLDLTMAGGGPELVRQALSHWMFEHIHPFADGNGRVGRLLVPLLVKRKGATRTACAFLGEAVHANKTVYVDALKHARRSGDFAAWTRVFLSLTARTAERNLSRLERLSALRDDWIAGTRSFRRDSVVHDLVPWILINPTFTITDARADIGRTFASVNDAVRRLAELGLVTQTAERGRDRLFSAPAVIDLFERA
jgi:Fic family protein